MGVPAAGWQLHFVALLALAYFKMRSQLIKHSTLLLIAAILVPEQQHQPQHQHHPQHQQQPQHQLKLQLQPLPQQAVRWRTNHSYSHKWWSWLC